jgi:hypothetical protein
MLTVFARLTLWRTKSKKPAITFVVSQIVETYAHDELNNTWLAGCILSDLFCCVSENGVPLNHESKAEDLRFVLQSVSRANTANTVDMNAPPLYNIYLVSF